MHSKNMVAAFFFDVERSVQLTISVPNLSWSLLVCMFCTVKIHRFFFLRNLTVNGFRLGYLAAPPKLSKACTTIQSQLTSCAGSISQAAGVAALTEVSEEEMIANVDIMREKRDFVISELRKMPNVSLKCKPSGDALL